MNSFAMTYPPHAYRRQSGVALIVGLVLLMLLTLVGTSGMQDTVMQEKMVSTTRDREIASQAAEATLRFAESQISGAASYNSVPGAVVVQSLDGMTRRVGTTVVTEESYWAPASTAWTTTLTHNTTLTGLKNNPLYVIEQLPATYSHVPGSLNIGTVGGKRITDYKVTVKAVGMSATTPVVLQSVFRRVDNS